MDGEKIDNNINVQKNGDNGVYEDFPKEIVHLLMKTHPMKADEQDNEFSTMSSREEIRAARKHRLDEAKKEYTNAESEAKAKRHEMVEKQTIQTEEVEQPDFNQTMAVILDDDDDDMVQLVRHKSRKKGYAKGFSTKATAQFEEIERTVKVEKTPRPSIKKESPFNEAEERETTENSRMPERKKIFDDDNDEIVKDKISILDSFFGDNDNYEYDHDEKKIKAKNIIMVGGIVIVLIFAVLFVKTISLTGKLNKAETQIEEYEDIQAKNEELKLNVLTLEEEVGKLKSGEEDAMPTDTVDANADEKIAEAGQTPTGEFDTYTVKDGDNYWIIADEVYGNGALYQKILDFNNLQENDKIKPGEVLKIPKQ
ncbi:MAG: LysM peptidoglycan-binding domain-containing protein [Anaerotignaceae bacterium]